MTLSSRARSLAKDLTPPIITRAYQRTIGGRRLAARQAADTQAFYGALIPANSLCFDIGANLGDRVAAFRRCGFRVVAVEPQPVCYAALQARFADDPAVTLINKAVGSRAGKATMLLSDDHIYSTLSQEFVDAATRSGRFGKAKWDNSIEVEVVTLDRIIETHGRPAFLKVDVEGFELEVVRGLSVPVDALSLEWLPTTTDIALGCLSYLSELGPIRCNLSFGESMKLATPEWVGAARSGQRAEVAEERDAALGRHLRAVRLRVARNAPAPLFGCSSQTSARQDAPLPFSLRSDAGRLTGDAALVRPRVIHGDNASRIAVTRTRRDFDAVLVVGLTLLCIAAPLLPGRAAFAAASGIAVLAALAWYRRCRAAAPLSAFCVICVSLAFFRVPYFQLILAVALLGYAGVVRAVPWLRGTATWVRWGSFDATVCVLCVGSWLLAAVALIVWYRFLHPEIADILKEFVPALPLGLLIVGGVLFSMVNAAVEEGAYRGVIFHALDTSLGTGFAALLLQALAFGAIHIRGFPRGWLGVGLACIYGLFMGVIRRRAAGMFAPWIAHVFTDLVIVAILLVMARPEKPNQALQGMIQSLPLIGLSASDPCRTAPAGSIRWPLPVLALIHSHTRSPSGLPVYVTAGQSVPFSPPV